VEPEVLSLNGEGEREGLLKEFEINYHPLCTYKSRFFPELSTLSKKECSVTTAITIRENWSNKGYPNNVKPKLLSNLRFSLQLA
jgi:hypothetical protein